MVGADFTIWGWKVRVARTPVEFLTLTNVTCASATVQGTGVVTLTPPAACRHDPVTVDLGPSAPVDEPANAGATPVYGRTVTVPIG